MRAKCTFYVGLLLLVSCSSGTDNELSTNSNSTDSEFVENGEIFRTYRNFPIVLQPEMVGDKECLVQQVEHRREDVIFRMKKVPTELYLNKEIPNATKSEFDSLLNELKGEQVFYFEIEDVQNQDLLKKYHAANYDGAVKYLSFDILNDLRICTQAGDTLKPNFALYERNFHLAPFERVLIDFSGLDQEAAFEFIYQDNLFGKGELRFSFPDQQFIDANTKDFL